MKKTVKRMAAIATTVITMATMLTGITANAAVTYKTLTYQTGNVDGIVGSTEVSFEKVINTTFDAAAASRFSRKGYTVASWNVPSTGETVALGAQYKMPSNDITFVANWKEAEYAVSFAGKGGKTADGKATTADKATFGTAMTLPECQFIYNGYTFAGWKYDNKMYNAGEEFEVPALLSGSKIVFSAVWEEESAVVTTEPTEAVTTTEETTIFVETSENVSEETTEEITETTTVETTVEETTTEETTETTVETEETEAEETNYVEIYEYIASEETEETTTVETEEAEEETTTTVETEEVEEEETTTVEIEETVEEETAVVFDYNNDGVVDSSDANALRKFIVGAAVEGFEITADNADVNGDGTIDVFDYMALSRIAG